MLECHTQSALWINSLLLLFVRPSSQPEGAPETLTVWFLRHYHIDVRVIAIIWPLWLVCTFAFVSIRLVGGWGKDIWDCRLQALVYDILPSAEGAEKRCSECADTVHSMATVGICQFWPGFYITLVHLKLDRVQGSRKSCTVSFWMWVAWVLGSSCLVNEWDFIYKSLVYMFTRASVYGFFGKYYFLTLWNLALIYKMYSVCLGRVVLLPRSWLFPWEATHDWHGECTLWGTRPSVEIQTAGKMQCELEDELNEVMLCVCVWERERVRVV